MRENIFDSSYRVVQLTGGGNETVGVNVAVRIFRSNKLKGRNSNAHNVAFTNFKVNALFWKHQSFFQHLWAHDRTCNHKTAVDVADFFFNLFAKFLVLADKIQEFLHQVISFVLQQLVAADGGCETFLQTSHLHTGRVDVNQCHSLPLLICLFSEGIFQSSLA